MVIKKVCIVGAGPSGLVAAKTLLHDAPLGTFQVHVFDTQPRIGGLWPAAKADTEGLVHPLMVANQSKHTVQFSDLAWEPGSPELPRAWQIGRYLERYQKTYCQRARLRLETTVVSAQPIPTAGGTPDVKWRVHSRGARGEEQREDFEYLLVASGYAGKPAVEPSLAHQAKVPVIHSSRYRDLRSLLDAAASNGGTILVVGGQMSGVEIAGTIATHLSSAIHAPAPAPIANAAKYSIHHISHRPVWVIPLHTSPKPTSSKPPFLPLDLPLYDLRNREHLLSDTQGLIAPESARTANSIFATVLGTDQSSFSPLLSIKGEMLGKPPYMAVSDTYMDFVRSGLITVSTGKLESLSGNEAVITPSGQRIRDIAAVVLATGFDASASLSFLPQSIQQTLSLTPGDLNNTVALAFHGTYHPDVPNIGFVGFYRSPYWGVIEMQARFLTAIWTSDGSRAPPLSPAMQAALQSDASIQRTMSLRDHPRLSQFPMGDYAYLMQQFATALGLERSPPLGPMDILTPARYAPENLSASQAEEVTTSLRQTHETAMAGLAKGKFVAKAVFRSLLGQWTLQRDLVSKRPSHPSGRFRGTANFLPREGTGDGGEGGDNVDVGLEYLYVEQGEVRASTGISLRTTIWRYDEVNDKLSVWSGKNDQERANQLFHEIDFTVPDGGKWEDEETGRWEAKATHLYKDNLYDVKYEFAFRAVNLEEWRIEYAVKGPKKDYTINDVYRRCAPSPRFDSPSALKTCIVSMARPISKPHL